MRAILLSLILVSSFAFGQGFTANELKHLPMLDAELSLSWPDVHRKSVFAAQIRQETCPSLGSKKCWSPTAELKTSREYGFGLGQLTVTSRFNNFNEAKKLDRSLKDWEWDNRYDATYQLRTMVLMDKFNYGKISWAADKDERVAMAFASYNGGLGGLLSDRAVCQITPGCDPSKWFGNIEHTSRKAKVKAGGYGKSFFEINREYVRHIMFLYPSRYAPFFGEHHDY